MEVLENSTFNTVLQWAELFYFLSGIGLLVVAGFGLYQIKLTKDQLNNAKEIFRKQSVRASFEAAANECNRFSEKLIPIIAEFDKYLKDESITFFKDSVIEETDDGFRVNYEKINKDDLGKIFDRPELVNGIVNGVEGFSLYIISGVADDNIAFHTLGKIFVAEAERVSKILPFTGAEQEDCKAIWALYFRWKNRLEHQKLQVEKGEIEKRLRKTKVQKFSAIGTEKT